MSSEGLLSVGSVEQVMVGYAEILCALLSRLSPVLVRSLHTHLVCVCITIHPRNWYIACIIFGGSVQYFHCFHPDN